MGFPYQIEKVNKVFWLPYDPRNYGWEFMQQIPCCLHFYKNGHLLRIKTDTQMIILNPVEVDEDGVVGEMKPLVHKVVVPPKTRESFEEKMGEWL